MKALYKILLAICCVFAACAKKENPTVKLSIKSISPLNAGGGDTITITGEGLKTIGLPVITVNDKQLTVVSGTNEVVKVLVPKLLGSGAVKVSNADGTVEGPYFTYQYKATVTTLAGNGSVGRSDGIGSAVSFNCPWGITIDDKGDLYIADTYNRLIRTISAATKQVSTITIPTYIGASGNFYSPYNIAIDVKSRNIYVTDFNRHMMRIAPDGQMSLIYDVDYTTTSTGIAVAPDGKLYMSNNTEGTILQFDPLNSYNYSQFSKDLITPRNIIFDKAGKMYVANAVVSKGAVISQIDDNGKATVLQTDEDFKGWEIAVDKDGNFYEADHFSNRLRIIEKNGKITTIAGSGLAADVDGVGLNASFNGPQGMAIDNDGNLYITTYNYDTKGGNKVRKVVVE
jgi:streptogramin lyase